jgi:hypothetical protein
LVRIYRLGQRSFTHLAFGELQRIDVSPDTRVTIVERITETLFAYVDWMSQQVVEVYEEERERWLETRNSMRALRVRGMLAGRKSVDMIRLPPRFVIRCGGIMSRWLWYPAATSEVDELVRMISAPRPRPRRLGQAEWWRYCIAAHKYWSSRRIDIATHADLTELLLDSDYLAPGASGGHQGCPARTAWLTSLP